MARTPKIAIVGGGIGGLAAALALHQRGIEVEVYEQLRITNGRPRENTRIRTWTYRRR